MESLPSSDSLEDVDVIPREEKSDLIPTTNIGLSDISVGDFVLAKVMAKKKEHFYVAEVCQILKSDCALEVKYLKRANRLSGNKFVYGSGDIFELALNDVIWKLPTPIPVGATTRQTNFLLFSVDFEHYNVE